MANFGKNKMAAYTFIWSIQNYTRPPHLNLQSPSFIVDSIEKTKWCLVLHVNQHCVLCYIKRLADNSVLKSMELNFELTVLSANGLPFKEQRGAYFHINHQSKIVKLIDNKVFKERRAEFLPKDTLTIRCQIWRKENETLTTDLCFARTQLRLVRRSFVWPVEKFRWLRYGDKKTYNLKQMTEYEPQVTLNMYLDEDNDGIHLEISLQGGRCCSITSEISIVDIEGKVTSWGAIGFQQNMNEANISLPQLMSKQQLVTQEDRYLPNNKGGKSCRVRGHGYFDETPASCSDSCNLKKALRNLYKDKTYSDITLKAGNESFQVHKNILSARSPMFKAMFSSDMMEKERSIIDLPDLDGITLHRMLLYIYTDFLEDLPWDEAFDLFRAADEYGLVDLKKRCSAIMKNSLNKTSVCDVLYVADMHHDEALILAAKDFIFEKRLELLDSKEWELFKRNNEQLASEILEYVNLINDEN
ncbi:Speckle-type POZ protein-like B like protein [Argiope bruennichi]|uniref:Speckle-type POZ protein-like B like protein n=1 Tax=Argiope bruennichi TaxID=94029 RepID=A0A8T0EE44_ARGBR|nr:Speckle-type POZ protein-like B like protein [Argiope bruennichi]